VYNIYFFIFNFKQQINIEFHTDYDTIDLQRELFKKVEEQLQSVYFNKDDKRKSHITKLLDKLKNTKLHTVS